MKLCIKCNEPNHRKRSPFCSRSCRDKVTYAFSSTGRKVKRCPICKGSFEARSSATYCKPCQSEYDASKQKVSMRHLLAEIKEVKQLLLEMKA